MKKYIFAIVSVLFSTICYAQNVGILDIEEATARIKEKEKELQLKEQELNAKEDKLNALEQDLIMREQNLSVIRQEITDKLDKLNTGSDEELDKLAKVYASTKPKQAASIFINMDLDKSAALMSRLNAMTAGKIMAEIAKQNPEYASMLTAKMSGDKSVQSLSAPGRN